MKKLLCAFLLAVSASISIGHVQAQVIVIANPGVKSDSVSKSELREVFTGSSTNLKDGTHVKPVLLKDCPAHAEFAECFNADIDKLGALDRQARSQARCDLEPACAGR